MTDPTEHDSDIVSLAVNLQICLNVLRVHDTQNEAALRAVHRVLENIHYAFLEESECVLSVSADQVFVNRERVRHAQEVADLQSLLQRIGVGGMVFTSPPEPDALAVFMTNLARRGAWEAPDECYVEPLQQAESDSGRDWEQLRPVRMYKRAVGEMRSIFHDARERSELNIRRARRLVGEVIETLVSDEATLFGLMAIRDYDMYTFQHSVNVCVLSSAVGTRLGLSRVAARELGVAALLHDAGKLEIPRHILTKKGKLTQAEWETMKSHPVLGARSLLSQRGLEPAMIKAVQVALEHHVQFDGGGYPEVVPPVHPSLFSRIVSICDCYDAMTSVRVYRDLPITPGGTIAYLWKVRGVKYDPALMKVLITMIGAYPPGSLLQLSDRSLAVSVEGPRTPDVFRPVVRRWDETETLDLSVMDGLRVVACLDPTAANVSEADVQRHLLPAA